LGFVEDHVVMSLSSAVLVVADYNQHNAQCAAMIYLAATRIATGLLCAGFLVVYAKTGTWDFADGISRILNLG
jgi:formate hydrogenlyase subunit 3/multisubunit Na+/H+ antiporter MnhD subunit